jgi:hypothetical protein
MNGRVPPPLCRLDSRPIALYNDGAHFTLRPLPVTVFQESMQTPEPNDDDFLFRFKNPVEDT